jgi:hypothetical protein
VAVDAVVGGHDRPDAALAHNGFERCQVQLAQGALVQDDVDGVALRLGVVGDEVLDRRADAFRLQPADVGGADPPGQHGILAEALEMASAVGGAVQVDGGRQQDVDAFAAGLGGQQPAQPFDTPLVPGGGERGGGGHVGRGVALVPGPAAHAGRAVGDDEPAQADGRLRMQGPEVGAGEEPDLLGKGEPGQPVPLGHEGGPAVLRRTTRVGEIVT